LDTPEDGNLDRSIKKLEDWIRRFCGGLYGNMSENRGQLSAAEVLRLYKEEDLSAFAEIALEDVNQLGNFGERPLHVAASRGILEEVAALVTAGSHINVKGDLDNTPLHEAVAQGNTDVVHYLLAHGARADVRNEFGSTPLDVARRKGRDDLIEAMRAPGQPED
jgi:hypothetical protein